MAKMAQNQTLCQFAQKWLRRFCSYCIFRSTRPISTTFVLTPCPGKISFSIYTPFYVNNSGFFQIFLGKSIFFDFESSDRSDTAYYASIKWVEHSMHRLSTPPFLELPPPFWLSPPFYGRSYPPRFADFSVPGRHPVSCVCNTYLLSF